VPNAETNIIKDDMSYTNISRERKRQKDPETKMSALYTKIELMSELVNIISQEIPEKRLRWVERGIVWRLSDEDRNTIQGAGLLFMFILGKNDIFMIK
jgi:hypothetical protein